MRGKILGAIVRLLAVSIATLVLFAFQPAYVDAAGIADEDGQQTPAQLPGSGDRPIADMTRGGTRGGTRGATRAGTGTAGATNNEGEGTVAGAEGTVSPATADTVSPATAETVTTATGATAQTADTVTPATGATATADTTATGAADTATDTATEGDTVDQEEGIAAGMVAATVLAASKLRR